MSLTPEEIADIAVKAALAAVQAVTAGAAAVPAKPVPELPDDPQDEAAARAVIAENERQLQLANALSEELLTMIMQPRHLEVFNWLANVRGVSGADLMRQILRAEIARETPNWREAQGKGGGSTKSAATLAALKGQ